ncbi:hypothetical protein BX666DRAFT_895372 [Dichotomocladium elegans]|nr:hypothetical protein BX666DRAFT_895372 [Dichotomocladium elegans]
MRARVIWLAFFRFFVLFLSLGTIACHIANLVLLGSRDWWPRYIPSIRGDRTMAILNLALMVAVIIYNTLKGGPMPWTNNADEPGAPAKTSPGFATYCFAYRNPKTIMRCWISDALWLGCLLVTASWLLLLVYVFAQSTSDIYDEDEEFEGYDYKQDVPMALSNEESTYHAASTPPQIATATTTAAAASAAAYNLL